MSSSKKQTTPAEPKALKDQPQEPKAPKAEAPPAPSAPPPQKDQPQSAAEPSAPAAPTAPPAPPTLRAAKIRAMSGAEARAVLTTRHAVPPAEVMNLTNNNARKRLLALEQGG